MACSGGTCRLQHDHTLTHISPCALRPMQQCPRLSRRRGARQVGAHLHCHHIAAPAQDVQAGQGPGTALAATRAATLAQHAARRQPHAAADAASRPCSLPRLSSGICWGRHSRRHRRSRRRRQPGADVWVGRQRCDGGGQLHDGCRQATYHSRPLVNAGHQPAEGGAAGCQRQEGGGDVAEVQPLPPPPPPRLPSPKRA